MKRSSVQGLLYFCIHFFLEVISFYVVTSYIRHDMIWMLALTYDFFAFVPQSVFGYLVDIGFHVNFALVGSVITMLALLLMSFGMTPVIVVMVLAVGNCMVHIQGAETTLHAVEGKIAPSAVFVSGGSFGVVTGKLLSGTVPVFFIMAINGIMLLLIAGSVILDQSKTVEQDVAFHFTKKGLKTGAVIILATAVVAVRSFMGFVLPTGWQETALHTVLLYCSMGVGKAVGGILADKIGIRKTAMLSTVGALPFLLLGNTAMWVSLIGIMLFSMTMAVTLGLIVSAIPSYPGVAFGCTTTGLFLGVLPVFFVQFRSADIKYIILTAMTALCIPILFALTEKTNGTKNDF